MITFEKPTEEKVDTQDFGMPLRYYFVDTSSKDEMTMFAHWHNEIEIQIFTQGNAVITIDNSEVFVGTGDILIIPPQSIHFGYSECNRLQVHTFVFHAEVICPQNRESSVMRYFNPFINRTVGMPYVIHSNDKGYDDIIKTMLNIIEYSEKKPYCYELEIQKNLIDFFICLYKNDYVKIKNDDSISNKNYLAIRDAISYIERNYSKPLTVELLSENAGFSKSRFMSIFKEYTNTTCKRYINQYRLESSLQKLRDTDTTVLNVAISSGYNNISLFNREFKKMFGVTPLEYRKKSRKERQ